MALTAAPGPVEITRHMKTTRWGIIFCSALVLAVAAGCAAKRKVPTEREQKEAALYASEGQFALNMKQWPRAEENYLKAARASPEGNYYLSLGLARLRQNKRSEAKAAYEEAVRAFADDAVRAPDFSEAWLRQAFVLAALGRMDESRAVIAQAAKKFPNDAKVRALTDPKAFEQMIAAPNFKEVAL